MKVLIVLKNGGTLEIRLNEDKAELENTLRQEISDILNNNGNHIHFPINVWDKELYILKSNIEYIQVY